MTTFIIITGFSYLISIILLFKKSKPQQIEKWITKTHFILLALFILTTILLLNEYRFKGLYTNSIIAQTFLSSTIILFGLTKSIVIRIYAGILSLLPLLVIPTLIGLIMFVPPLTKTKINKRYNLETHYGGFLACGENLVLTKGKYLIFDQQIFLGRVNLDCIRSIYRVDVIELVENKHIIYKAYHHGEDGERDYPNPYIDTMEITTLPRKSNNSH